MHTWKARENLCVTDLCDKSVKIPSLLLDSLRCADACVCVFQFPRQQSVIFLPEGVPAVWISIWSKIWAHVAHEPSTRKTHIDYLAYFCITKHFVQIATVRDCPTDAPGQHASPSKPLHREQTALCSHEHHHQTIQDNAAARPRGWERSIASSSSSSS
jgi:hypothetical protein